MTALTSLKIALIVMFFYSFSITLIAYSLQNTTALSQISEYTSKSHDIDSVYGKVNGNLNSQTKIPVMNIETLIFYSGNILVDLMLNFIFAIPEMIGLFVHGIMMMLGVDSFIFAYVEAFASMAIIVFYIIELIETLLNIRTRVGIV